MNANRESTTTTKYCIRGKIEIDGVVETPDVVGALFGQTEGLLGEDLDLRELQQSGRIGRIKVDLKSKSGKSTGIITIPCSLDRTETAILAAALETVDRVGPCSAKITLEKLEDVREEKRKQIIDRAVDLLRDWESEVSPDSHEMTDTVMRESRIAGITKFGKENLPAGPDIEDSDTIIIVEGRADVLALLRAGIRNSIAVEGTNIPKSVIELVKNKTVITFLDGDRGGDLILKELSQVAKIDFIARAPTGREVEELTHKEIAKALRNRVPAQQVLRGLMKKPSKEPKTSTTSKTKRRTRRTTSQKTKDARRSTRRTTRRKEKVSKPVRKPVSKPKEIDLPDQVQKAAQKNSADHDGCCS
jgi:DNA primase